MKKIIYVLVPILFFVYSCSSDSGNEPEEMQQEMMEEEMVPEEEEEEVVCNPPDSIFLDTITQNSASLFWSIGQGAQSTVIEYGLEGFMLGTGDVITQSNDFVNIENLQVGTTYDVYFSSNCGSNVMSEVVGPIQFETLPACIPPSNFTLLDTQISSILLQWQPAQNTTAWELEYGIVGFELGTGTTIQTSDTFFEIDGLVSNTTYEVYLRTNCGSEGFSDYLDPIVATTDEFGSLFTGQYIVTQDPGTPSNLLFGENVFGIDDQNGLVITLFGPDQAPSQTIEAVTVSDSERAFDASYGEAAGLGGALTYVLNFSNEQVILSQNEETSLACSDLMLLGAPVGAVGSYSDDNQFTFIFREDVLNSCGSPVDITLTFTKL